MEADEDGDGKLSFEEFARTVANTVCALVFFLVLGFWTLPCRIVLAKTCSRASCRISLLHTYLRRSRILTPFLRIL
jgi:hypothetical protein